MRKTILSLAASAVALFAASSATAEESPPDISTIENVAKFEEILTKTEEFVAATAAAEEGSEPEWADFVDEDANTVWGIITDLTGSEEEVTVDGEATTVGDFAMGKLNGLSEEGNQAIYDNAWTNADALTPWLTHNIWVLIAAFLVFIMHLGFATLESGLCQKKERGQHPLQELLDHCLRDSSLLPLGLQCALSR